MNAMSKTAIVDYRIYRYQFRRDRLIGDSQLQSDEAVALAVELIDASGRVGLGIDHCGYMPYVPSEAELSKFFAADPWKTLEGFEPASMPFQVRCPRGGNIRSMAIPFELVIQQACWDLFAQSLDRPLWKLLGAQRRSIPVYASGLDFHLSDQEFCEFFGLAEELGYRGFKIKVGHKDLQRDVHRLDLLRKTVGDKKPVMIDANEAWTAQEAIIALKAFAKAGHEIYWVEDPIPRHDFDGLRMLRQTGLARVNSGEYLNLAGKRSLLEAHGCDMLCVHGGNSGSTDLLQAARMAHEFNVEIVMGNSLMEYGVNFALATPNIHWLEHSRWNYEHLIENSYPIRDGLIYGHDASGHGLKLSEGARTVYRRPEPISREQLGEAPPLAPGRVVADKEKLIHIHERHR